MQHNDYIRDIDNANTAVLLIHGILGTPNHFKDFVKVIPSNMAIHNICLDGHGGTVEEFSHSSMNKWRDNAEEEVRKLIKDYKNIIVVAHSMGTLFAIELSIKYPQNIKALFLLACPIKIWLKPEAGINAIKVIFDNIDENDEKLVATRDEYSIEHNMKLWKYTGWLPRYLELFEESRKVRNIINEITVKTYVFLSLKDELVSIDSYKYFTHNENIELKILKNSMHCYYEKSEKEFLLHRLKQVCKEVDNI